MSQCRPNAWHQHDTAIRTEVRAYWNRDTVAQCCIRTLQLRPQHGTRANYTRGVTYKLH